MHGLDIAKNLLKRIQQEADKHGLKKVSKVYLELGDRCGLDLEELDLCFRILSKDTSMEQAVVEAKLTPSNQIVVSAIEGE